MGFEVCGLGFGAEGLGCRVPVSGSDRELESEGFRREEILQRDGVKRLTNPGRMSTETRTKLERLAPK